VLQFLKHIINIKHIDATYMYFSYLFVCIMYVCNPGGFRIVILLKLQSAAFAKPWYCKAHRKSKHAYRLEYLSFTCWLLTFLLLWLVV